MRPGLLDELLDERHQRHQIGEFGQGDGVATRTRLRSYAASMRRFRAVASISVPPFLSIGSPEVSGGVTTDRTGRKSRT
jgi:hypothetical protein